MIPRTQVMKLFFIIPVFLFSLMLLGCGNGGSLPSQGLPENLSRDSVDSTGTEGNGTHLSASVRSDGGFEAFDSDAGNLAAGDTNGAMDIFLRHTRTGAPPPLSIDSTGTEGNVFSAAQLASIIGGFEAFDSDAGNLAAGDSNAVIDVFRAHSR